MLELLERFQKGTIVLSREPFWRHVLVRCTRGFRELMVRGVYASGAKRASMSL